MLPGRPGDASEFVGQPDGGLVEAAPVGEIDGPGPQGVERVVGALLGGAVSEDSVSRAWRPLS
jgi:hypothetical protein